MPSGNPGRKLGPGSLHELAVFRKVSQPKSVNAGALGIKNSRIKGARLSRRVAVNDHASEIAQTVDALRGVLSAQHFENDIHSLAVSQSFDGLAVVLLFVVDAMLKSQPLHAIQLLLGRGGAVHLYP